MRPAPENRPLPLDLRRLPRLAWRTALADRSRYRRNGRVSLRGIGASVLPSLRDPIFIVGAPRSGTTFLGDCVAAIPTVSYHFEPVATKAAARYVYERLWEEPRARFFYRAVFRWLLRIHADGGKRFAEKTPRNCFIVDFLHRVFPDARFLFIVRDGRDAALSHRELPWLRAASAGSGRRDPGGYAYGPYPRFWVEPERREEFFRTTDLHRCIWAWRRHNEAALEHFSAIPRAVLMIRYEELVRDPATQSAGILDFLGVRGEDSRRGFLAVARRATTRTAGRWRKDLSAAESGMVEREAGRLLRRLGYGPGPHDG